MRRANACITHTIPDSQPTDRLTLAETHPSLTYIHILAEHTNQSRHHIKLSTLILYLKFYFVLDRIRYSITVCVCGFFGFFFCRVFRSEIEGADRTRDAVLLLDAPRSSPTAAGRNSNNPSGGTSKMNQTRTQQE